MNVSFDSASDVSLTHLWSDWRLACGKLVTCYLFWNVLSGDPMEGWSKFVSRKLVLSEHVRDHSRLWNESVTAFQLYDITYIVSLSLPWDALTRSKLNRFSDWWKTCMVCVYPASGHLKLLGMWESVLQPWKTDTHASINLVPSSASSISFFELDSDWPGQILLSVSKISSRSGVGGRSICRPRRRFIASWSSYS